MRVPVVRLGQRVTLCDRLGFNVGETKGGGVRKYVLFYESSDDVLEQAPRHFAAHQARYEDFHGRGMLLLIGTFADTRRDGAMAVFTTREAAEEFAGGDPFVLNEVVRAWEVREWNEVLAE